MASSTAVKRTRSDVIFDTCNIILMVLILLIVVYPLWFVVIASFSESAAVLNGEVLLWPKGFHLDAYVNVFQNSKIMTGYRNTIFYTFVGTLLNVVATVALAYPLSRKDFAGHNVIMVILTVTMFFNGGLIPTYLIYKQLHITNTIWVMLIPGLVSVYNTILMRTFFQNLPYDLQEAAMIDGCSNMRILLQIIIPLSKPIIAVMVIYYGVGHWNEYFNALVYLTDKKLQPLQLVLREILITMTDSGGDKAMSDTSHSEKVRMAESLKFAAIIVSTVPMLCLYPFAQKYFAKGVMIGAIKG